MPKKLRFIRVSEITSRVPSVKINDGVIVIKTNWHRKHSVESAWFYIKDADSPLKLLCLLHHLGSNVWLDGDTVSELIRLVCDYHGWKLFGGTL